MGGRCGAGIGLVVGIAGSTVGGGGGVARPDDSTNLEGTQLIQGTLVAQDGAVAKGLRRAIATADNNLSRPVGIAAEAIDPAATGEVATVTGDRAEVAMVAGLAPPLGEEVILSTTAGLGTIPGSGVAEPGAAGNVVQRVGLVLDISMYAGSQRVLVQLDFSQRRLVG